MALVGALSADRPDRLAGAAGGAQAAIRTSSGARRFMTERLAPGEGCDPVWSRPSRQRADH
jgi:hypothetical protein